MLRKYTSKSICLKIILDLFSLYIKLLDFHLKILSARRVGIKTPWFFYTYCFRGPYYDHVDF